MKVAPDGTLWVLVNTFVQSAWRWQLWHLDAEGELDAPQVGARRSLGAGST
jgi:hypothetical protein